ncbi:MAG: hypothetical protein WCS52_06815 [bacterium]
MKIFARIRNLRKDTSGSALLLSGTMMFLVVMTVVLNGDTNKAVYDRIVAQNAVDAAAEAAALWEARGCNVIQHLNNIHYEGNKILFTAESVALVGCGASVFAIAAVHAAKPFFWTSAYAGALTAAGISCLACSAAPVIDKGQEYFATAINDFQEVARTAFPILAIGYAHQIAQASGGDNLIEVIPQYVGSLMDAGGVPWGGTDDVLAALDSLPAPLDSLSIAAIPWTLVGDDTFFTMGLKTHEGDGLPWKTSETWNDAADLAYTAGKGACKSAWEGAWAFQWMLSAPDQWGWTDKYYQGNPGYMTWVAGKKYGDEVAGLGNTRWLRAKEGATFVDTNLMYSGEILNPDTFRVPAFIALASSQVEGTPVISYTDEVNSRGTLIPVYLPFNYKKPTRGDELSPIGIYH